MNTKSKFKVNLFYSYSHKDQQFRRSMERSLSLLRDQDGVLREWSDYQVPPGQPLLETIDSQIRQAEIVAMLLSPDFIASTACMDEWRIAETLLAEKSLKMCIPIILRPCAWHQIHGLADLKALPNDGKPISKYGNRDEAWQQVHLGIKEAVNQLKRTFSMKADFRRELEQTDFISATRVKLQDIFVFPNLSSYLSKSTGEVTEVVTTVDDILSNPLTLIHGEQLSGKTALCRHLMLRLVGDLKPVLYMDLKQTGYVARTRVFRTAYENQFSGDYHLWMQQDDKTIILDNLSRSPRAIEFLSHSIEQFDRVIVTLSSDIFYAYYRDEDRIAGFREVKILPFTHIKQEDLIRNRANLLKRNRSVSDGQIDDLERRVNSIVINNRILPRYPFYVLSILQTCETFMPSSLSITSSGHCHYVLIIAHLIRSGISNSDDEINSCFNFAEHLAFEIYRKGSVQCHLGGYLEGPFIEDYRRQFIISDSTLNRLFDPDYGLVTASDQFRYSYMYYYFLGKYFANNSKAHPDLVAELLEKSFLPANCLTIVSIIHHTNDGEILDAILSRTTCALEGIPPATLDRDQSEAFETIIQDLPLRVLSSNSVRSERKKERRERDRWEVENVDGWGEEDKDIDSNEPIDIYRILKNNEILGQVLRNRYGSLRQKKLCEIIETIAAGGLRLVRLLLDKKMINEAALMVNKRNPDVSVDRARWMISMATFFWTVCNVEWIVSALNKPEIHSLVDRVVETKKCPAYDLIEYFLHLDAIHHFQKGDRDKLKRLWDKHEYSFFRRVVSLRTQWYLRTHTVPEPLEQSVCSILNVKYQRRIKER